jgi:hypothetical protein
MSYATATSSQPKAKRRYLWGYLSINVRYAGSCCACEGAIEKSDLCWWHPKLGYLRCFACPPDEDDFKWDEFAVWYFIEGNGRYEEDLRTEDELREAEKRWEQNKREVEETEGRSQLGVVWLAGDLGELDEYEGEHEQGEDGEDRRQSGQGGQGEETSFLSPIQRMDASPARKLTELEEVLSRPFETLLSDLTPTLEHHITESRKRSGGRFERDDLRGVAYLKLVEAMPKFDGRGSFGAYLDTVIPSALTDYARRERRNEGATSQ